MANNFGGQPAPQTGVWPIPGAPTPVPGPMGQLQLQIAKGTISIMSPEVVVTMNGPRMAAAIGDNVYTLPVGWYRVSVQLQWLVTKPTATIDVYVAAGQTIRLYFTGPASYWGTGRIGMTPQTSSGSIVLLVVVGVVVGLPLLWSIFIFLLIAFRR